MKAQKYTKETALNNAVTGQSIMNYDAILKGFVEMGIPVSEILPRENIFTFNAWLAKGRVVSKGQHGIKVVTFVPIETLDKKTGEVDKYKKPHTTTVFHISQTQAIN